MLGVSRCKMRHLQTKVGHLLTILGGLEVGGLDVISQRSLVLYPKLTS